MTENFPPNTTLAYYRIVSKIGAGGMGEVYLAQDTRLDRKVAIKFLNEEFSRDADKLSRFIQEAKAASALNHPNILTVYEIGEVDGKNYIATELIDGQTLREHLSHNESLQLNQILKIGVQVAEALSAAHQAGIIHRDIKPENIMLRKDGYAKVLDFGLAKLAEPKAIPTGSVGSEDVTQVQVNTTPGIVMGTVSYMSPEQARGKETDARTDIWSLGVVLYEMLSGKVPFTGETINHTIVSILEREPLLLMNVPAELQRIVRKAMTKDVEMRYQSARDLLIDLKNLRRELDLQGELERSIIPNRATTTESAASNDISKRQNLFAHQAAKPLVALIVITAVLAGGFFGYRQLWPSETAQIRSIAVLPFVNESGDPELEYLSDGMTDSLIRSLSQVPNLSVKARSTIFRYKGKEADPRSLGRELGVQALLKGRLNKRADQITLGLELIKVGDENVIWTEQYDRKLADLVVLQSEIGRDVSSKISTKLSGADVAKLNKQHTAVPMAYQLYLRGRYEGGKFTEDGYNKCIEYLNQAIARDPNFVLAYDGLSFCYYANWYLPAKIGAEKGRAAATRALELDPDLPEAHASLATIAAWFHYDWETAEKGFRRALEINPELALAHSYNGVMFASLGRFDQAIAETEKGVELEPFSAEINSMLGLVYFYSGRYEKAEGQFRKTIEIDPSFWYAHTHLARSIEKLGDREAAVSMLERARSMQGATAEPLMHLGRIYAASGRRADAEKIIDELKRPEWTIQMDGYEFAVIYAALGAKDTAFAYLDNEYARGSWWLNFAKVDPDLDPLRSDPRFAELLRKLNFTN